MRLHGSIGCAALVLAPFLTTCVSSSQWIDAQARVRISTGRLVPSDASLLLGSVLRAEGVEVTVDRLETRRVMGTSVAMVDDVSRDLVVRPDVEPSRADSWLPWQRGSAPNTTVEPARVHSYVFARVRNVGGDGTLFPFALSGGSADAKPAQVQLGATGRLVALLPEDTPVLMTGDESCAGSADIRPLAADEMRGLVLVFESDLEAAGQYDQRLQIRFANDLEAREVLLRTPLELDSMRATNELVLPLLKALHDADAPSVCALMADGTNCDAVSDWIDDYQATESRLGRHALTVEHRLAHLLLDGTLQLALAVAAPCELSAEGYLDCMRTVRVRGQAPLLRLRARKQPDGVRLLSASLALTGTQRVELERDVMLARRFGADCWMTPLSCKGEVVECVRGTKGVSVVLDDEGSEVCRSTFDLRVSQLDTPQEPAKRSGSMCPPRDYWDCSEESSAKVTETLNRRAFTQLIPPNCGAQRASIFACLEERLRTREPCDQWRGVELGNFRSEQLYEESHSTSIPYYEEGHWLGLGLGPYSLAGHSTASAELWIYSDPWATVSIGEPLGDRLIAPERLVAESRAVGLTPLMYTGLRLTPGLYAVTLTTVDGRISTRDVHLGAGSLKLLYVHIGRGEHARSMMQTFSGDVERTWERLPDGRVRETTGRRRSKAPDP